MHRLPFDAGRESRTATTAQTTFFDRINNRLTNRCQGVFQPLVAPVRLIVFQRARVGHTDAAEGQTSLCRQRRDLFHRAERQRVFFMPIEHTGFDKRLHIVRRRHRPISDTFAVTAVDFDHRLEPEQTARAVTYETDVMPRVRRKLCKVLSNLICTEGNRRRIARHVHSDCHRCSPSSSSIKASKRVASTRPARRSSMRIFGPVAQLPRQ